MPTYSSTPRSSGGSFSRGGTVSATPRSSSRGVDFGRANAAAGASFAAQAAADTPGSSTPIGTVVGSVLNAASVPAYAVGQAILHPTDRRTWTASGLDIFRDDRRHVMPGQALRQRGALDWIPTAYGLRSAAALIGDVVGDPTTWISGGMGPAARIAEGAGQVAARDIGKAASKHLDAIVKSGRAPTLRDIADAAALTAAERKAAENTFKVSVRVPFTRGREVLLGETTALHDTVGKLAARIGETNPGRVVKEGVSTGRGLDPLVNQTFQALSRAARREEAQIAAAARDLETTTHGIEKQIGLTRGEGLKAISLHLDNPDKYALPAGLADMSALAADLLERIKVADQQAGIVFAERPHYVSHLGATRKDSDLIRRLYAGSGASTLDEPFFVKPRDAANLDQFARAGEVHGFTPEYNIARIIERRGRASVRARMKKALDEAVVGIEGVKPPPREVPGVEGALSKVQTRATALSDAVASGDATATATAQKRLTKAEAQLEKRRARASAFEQGNAALEARPGRPSTPEEWTALRQQWSEIENATKYHEGTLLPPEVKRSLDRVHERIAPSIFNETALSRMGQTVGHITSRWKALALLSPGYHVRNLWDDGMRAYWAGARDPVSFTQASKLLKARKGKGALDATIEIDGTTWTREELLRRAEAHDVIDTGFARIETHSSEDMTGHRIAGPGRGPLTRASRTVGTYRENVIRLGTWIELLKRGENPAEAARTVREFLFDYGDVGAAVERARRFWFPFITYPSKAIPFVAREFARRPGRVANLNAAMTDLTAASGSPDRSLLPIGSASSFAVPIPGFLSAALGGKPGQANLVNPERLFSFGNLNQLDLRRKNLLLNFSSLLNPYASALGQNLTGYSTYFGRPYAKRVKAPLLIQGLDAIGVPIQGYGPKYDSYLKQTVPGYSPYLDTFLRTLPPFSQSSTLASGDTSKTRSALARYLGGVPFSPYDRAKDLYYAQRYGPAK